MIPGNLIHIALSSGASFRAVADEFDVYTGYSVTIPSAQLFANDVDLNNNIPFTLVSVQDSYGGVAVVDGTNVVFTSSGGVGGQAGFKYTSNNSIGEEATGSVKMNVVELPAIIPNADTFECTQGAEVLINYSSLTSNDIDPAGLYPLTVTGIHSPYGGTYTTSGTTVTFTSNGITGEPAGFKYDIKNSAGQTGTGDVYIDVTPLPDVEALLWSTTSDLDTAINAGYAPPTFKEIFDNWPRYSHANSWTQPYDPTELNYWVYYEADDRILFNRHSGMVGITSIEKLENYTHQARLTSNDDDPGPWDSAGLVIAFYTDPSTGYEYTLTAQRSAGQNWLTDGSFCAWGVAYNSVHPGEYCVARNNVIDPGLAGGGYSSGASYNWRYWPLGTTIKVERKGDIIRCWSSQMGSTTLVPESEIVIDLDSDSRLHKFKGPQSYGYCVYSQPAVTWTYVSVTGGLDASKMYDMETGAVWIYSNSAWSQSTETIQEALGYPRNVTNPESGETFFIEENQITLV